MKSARVASLFISLIIHSVAGQDLRTSHTIWNLPTYNAGALTSTHTSRATFDYRRAGLLEGVSFTSASAWIDYPLLYRNKNEGAFFMMVEQQQSGGATDFNTIKISTALAKKIALTKLSHVTFGLGLGYKQFGMSLSGFTTSSQFVDGIGFDPSLPNGESSGYYRSSYLTINSGLFYQSTNSNQSQLFSLGLSAQNLNKQLKTWEGYSNKLPIQWSSQMQYLILTHSSTAVGPDIELFEEGSKLNAVGGFSFRYYTSAGTEVRLAEAKQTYINLFLRAATQKKAILGFQFTNGKLMGGVSYDFPFGNLSRIYGNAFEILIALTPEINHNPQSRNRKRPREKNPKIINTPSATTEKKTPAPAPVTEPSKSNIQPDTTSENIKDKAGQITVGSITDEGASISPKVNPVYFISGSSDLDASSRDYLDKIYSAFLKNRDFVIVITGHTDDVGAHESNQKLSLQRAKTAYDYLIKLGVPAEQIIVKGEGEDEPLVPNDSPENRARNRRVEINLIRK